MPDLPDAPLSSSPDPSGAAPSPSPSADEGWDQESASAPIGPIPDDTTSPEGRPFAGSSAAEELGPPPASDGDAVSAGTSREGAPAAAPPKKRPRVSAAARTAEIHSEISELTRTKHELRREIDTLRRDMEAQRPRPAPTAAPPPAPTEALPTQPRLADFETEEAYQEAMGAWVQATIAHERTQLTRDLDTGLDRRFQEDRAVRGAEAARDALLDRLGTAKAQHPDWDELRPNLGDLRSSWVSDDQAAVVGLTPFLTDLVHSHPAGGEILHFLMTDPERGQALADLYPTRPLRDAIVISPSPLLLLEHFATDEGAQEFEQLRQMHPLVALQAMGALTARLAAAGFNGSPAARAHPITQAQPAAKLPAGTPRARDQGRDAYQPSGDFLGWMASEDRKEREKRARELGVTLPASA